MDIPSFLRRYAPFDVLDEETLRRVVRHTRIEFFPEGHVVLQQGGEPARWLYVIRTGAIELLDEGRVLDLLVDGEIFGHTSLLSGMAPAFAARAQEDTLCYLIDREVAKEILESASGLSFLSSSLRRRMVRALEGQEPENLDPLRAAARTLVRRAPITCAPVATVREAAEIMASQRVSSLLVPRGDGLGIITDRDLRSRVLAVGRSPDTIVGEVMSYPAVTVSADAMLTEVIQLMLERGVHHLPVLDDEGKILGVVTDTDLMGLERKTPFALKSAIERAHDEGSVIAEGRGLQDMVCALVDANIDPVDIGHVVAVTIDAMTRKLLELGVGRLGDPPAPWAWLTLGSEARHEQALLTDQDHALAYEPKELPLDAVDPYFEKLAEGVTAGLEEAGIPRCRAGVIAANREWRRPVAEWIFQFRSWIDDTGRMGPSLVSIAFDYRQVAGSLDVQSALDDVIRSAPRNPLFMRHLAHATVDLRPPTGFLRDLVVEAKGTNAGKLDVKHGGITPITNLARTYAVGSGFTENRTPKRLRDAAQLGRIEEETRAGLEEAFRLLWQIRLEHQVAQVKEERPVDDFVDPRSLGPLTRQGLKESFRLIDKAQRALAAELGMRSR